MATKNFRLWIMALIAGCSIMAPAMAGKPVRHHSKIERPPVVSPPPLVPSPWSEEGRREFLENEQTEYLNVSQLPNNSARKLIVGYEFHYGIFFTNPVSKEDIWARFANDTIHRKIEEADSQEQMAAHIGNWQLICDCSGVEWGEGASRAFLVREAKLEWVKPDGQ